MMTQPLVAIYALDHPDSLEKRQPLRPLHLARLAILEQANRLTLAGPLMDATGRIVGSLIIANFRDLTEAETWFSQDPYVIAGIYQHISIRIFDKVLPEIY